MTEPQIIHTAVGDLVVIPRAEYEALIAASGIDDAAEDVADIAAFDAAMIEMEADREAGRDPTLPSEVGALMLNGASRLTAWRKHRGLSQQVLAQRADVGQGYLSQIERGDRVGTAETLKRIADGLGLRVDQIG